MRKTHLLQDSQEEALYGILGKALNMYIEKNSLPPHRLLRILTNMQLQIINQIDQEK